MQIPSLLLEFDSLSFLMMCCLCFHPSYLYSVTGSSKLNWGKGVQNLSLLMNSSRRPIGGEIYAITSVIQELHI